MKDSLPETECLATSSYMNSMTNFIKIFQNLNIYMTLKKCFILCHQNNHRLIEAGIKCLVGGADDVNLNETYIRRVI